MHDPTPTPIPFARRALIAAPLALAAVVGCGPSDLGAAYSTYVAQVDPVMEQEAARWKELAGLLQDRKDDLASPRYFKFLEATALPFYTDMRERLVAIAPENERVAAAHRELLRFADARLEFVHVEESSHDVYKSMLEEEGVLEVFSGLAEAENLRYEYQEAVGKDVPDTKLGELYAIVDTFRRRYFDPMQQGAKDPEELQIRLRSHVIRALEELHRRKYTDDEKGRLLKACVASWLDWHRKLERACPLLQRVWQVKSTSQAAADEADEALTAFQEALAEIRRDR